MSVEEKYEMQLVAQNVCVERTRRCDVCDSEIKDSEEYWSASTVFNDGDCYHHDHRFELYDMCSKDCVIEQLKEFFDMSRAVHFEVDKHNYFTVV